MLNKACHRSFPLVVGCLVSLAMIPRAEAGPSISCAEPIHDFGQVSGVEHVEHTFVLKNDGDEALTIERVKTSCGCTTTQLAAKEIGPGEEVELKSKLSLKGRSGILSKSIFVHSDDPETPRYQLTLRVSIHREMDVRPSQAYFPLVEGKPIPSRSHRIVFDLEEPVTITGLKTNNADFAQIALKTITPGKEYEAVISIKGELRDFAGNLRGDAVFTTDHARYDTITIPIIAYVRRDIIVAPPKIVLTRPAIPEQPVRKSIRVQNRTTAPLAITKIDTPSSNVTAVATVVNEYAQTVSVVITDSTDIDGKKIMLHVEPKPGKIQKIAVPLEVWQSKPK